MKRGTVVWAGGKNEPDQAPVRNMTPVIANVSKKSMRVNMENYSGFDESSVYRSADPNRQVSFWADDSPLFDFEGPG
jgi:hypothetical protein